MFHTPLLTGPQPTPLIQQAGTCIFSPSLDREPTPPALTSRSHSLPWVDGSRALHELSPSTQVRHTPCSRCPGRRWSLLQELPGGLGSSLHLALAFLPEVQQRAPRAPGKLCDSVRASPNSLSTLGSQASFCLVSQGAPGTWPSPAWCLWTGVLGP